MFVINCLLLLFIFKGCECVAVTRVNLVQDWVLTPLNCIRTYESLNNQQLSVSIPMTLNLALIHQKLIPDPFIDNNWENQKEVSKCHANFTKKFTIPSSSQAKYAQLVLEGIDTYGSVYLNNQLVGTSNNAFVQFRKNVTVSTNLIKDTPTLLVGTQNILTITIESSQEHDNLGQRTQPMPFAYAQTRKACYQYSWDWAPEMKSIGLWKPVYIELSQDLKIDYVWVRNQFVSESKATLNFAVCFKQMNPSVNLQTNYQIQIFSNGISMHTKDIENLEQLREVYIKLDIDSPKLWWPRGVGIPHIYDFEVTLVTNGQKIDTKKIPYGIRTVSLNLQNKQFQVIVNGHAIYCKGANYVPMDMIYPRLTNPKYASAYGHEQLFEDAVESNYNMIRLWGGGQYESDYFYELASRKGIMLFFDFMFSDSIYPGSTTFLQNVQIEIKQQVRRIRNYPALALFSGNNQILQGIQSWGWGQDRYIKNYHLLFEQLIPQVIKYQAPDISYIPSSPIYGVGNFGFDRGGDVHYWGVWAAGSPFQSYEQAIGPFNSQFGTQALPVYQTIKDFISDPNKIRYQSPQFAAHERHGSRFSTLRQYISQYTGTSIDMEAQSYLSGLTQAHGVGIAIIAQKIAKPRSYGTLYWQMNDAWPGISWSSIDYYGRWKPLQYLAKRLYHDVTLLYKDGIVYAINDRLTPALGLFSVKVIDFNGKEIIKDEREVQLSPDSVTQYRRLAKNELGNANQVLIRCEAIYGKHNSSVNVFFQGRINQLALPEDPTLQVKLNLAENKISLQSDKLIKNLHITSTQKWLKLSDNYMDIVPGIQTTVELLSAKLQDIHTNLRFAGYRQAISSKPLKVQITKI